MTNNKNDINKSLSWPDLIFQIIKKPIFLISTVFIVFIAIGSVWLTAHLCTEAGKEVSVFWGFVHYTKANHLLLTKDSILQDRTEPKNTFVSGSGTFSKTPLSSSAINLPKRIIVEQHLSSAHSPINIDSIKQDIEQHINHLNIKSIKIEYEQGRDTSISNGQVKLVLYYKTMTLSDVAYQIESALSSDYNIEIKPDLDLNTSYLIKIKAK